MGERERKAAPFGSYLLPYAGSTGEGQLLAEGLLCGSLGPMA